MEEIKSAILQKLKSDELLQYLNKLSLNNMLVFGSLITEDFNENSDVDIAIPDNVNDIRFVEDLKRENVLVASGRRFFLEDNSYKKGIRLSIAGVNVDEINRGFEIINNQFKKYI